MHYLYLIISVVCVSTSGIFGGFFNRKNEGTQGAGALYSLLTCFSALVSWGILYLCDFSFDPLVLLYSLDFVPVLGISFTLKKI